MNTSSRPDFPHYDLIVQHSTKKIIQWFDEDRNWVPTDSTEYQEKIEKALDRAFQASNQDDCDSGIIDAITIEFYVHGYKQIF